MMATEATSNNFEDPSTVTAQPPNNAGEPQQDGAATPPQVNGEAKGDLNRSLEALGDELLQPNSADVSVNGGSDNEAARSENSKSDAEGKSHNRTASTIKKPVSFKAVSVNKTFLAAKVATGAITPKSDGKASPSPSASSSPSLSSAPKPRLVAKTGSSLRDAAQRNAAIGTSGTAGGAASAVWNKNQPVAPQEPKRLTDEELKQRYGIHLATRLQTDDQGNKQATWADIDEDEDDWAPDSIVWGDGTKASLAPVDEPAPTPPPQVQPIPVEEPKPIEIKPKSPVPSTAASSPSLKLGGISSTSGKGLVLKGAAEKPTLVAKPPGPPTPVKSPWAPLPPVDKSSPVIIDPPQTQQQYQPRFTNRNPHGFEGMPQPPAKEIAADDFSRSAWRDGNMNQNRELYNSHSGRYEPVNDNRRGSRTENPRLPAVLQRPSHPEYSGPAEPSAAFQTHRSSADGSHGRRRTSSNVSGGSGHFVRRMSSGRHDIISPHEMHSARRGSTVAVSDAPTSPRPVSATGQHLGARTNSNMSHPSPATVYAQPVAHQPQVPFVDEVEIQKKIMRESRETARKRRLEEEAREEAERKERIRLKLEAMGPAPEKKPKKEAVPEEKSVPLQIQARKASVSATSPAAVMSDTVKSTPDEAPAAKGLPPAPPQEPTSGFKTARPHESQAANGTDRPSNSQNRPSYQSHENKSPTRPWQSGASDSFSSWNQVNAAPTSSRSVWGPPSNNKALGNGTFDPELGGLPDIHSSQQPIGSAPGPIGPPHRNSQQYDRSSQHNSRPGPIGPPQGSSRPDQQRRPVSGWNSSQEEQPFREQQERLSFSQQGGASADAPPVYKDTWRKGDAKEAGPRSNIAPIAKPSSSGPGGWSSFASQIAKDDAAKREDLDRAEAIRREQRAAGQLQDPVYRDTWKEVGLDQTGSRTGIRNITTSTASATGAASNISPNPRGSRFFPVRDVRLEEQSSSYDRPGSPSPPPPTTFGHPAYDGDVEHPTVCIPPPAPRVKLPPPAVLPPIGPPKPPSFAAAAATPVVPALPMNYAARVRESRPPPPDAAHPENWQKRISNLLGRGNQHAEPRAFAVDSASKHALELPDAQTSATVTLPGAKGDIYSDPFTSVITKPMAEECFEEQEMGSLPIVKVPRGPTVPWMPIEAPKTNLRKPASPHTTSIDSHGLSFPPRGGNMIQIKFSFMDEPKLISMSPREPRQKSNRGRGRGQPRHTSSTYPRGGRARDASGGFASPPAGDQAASPSSSSPRPTTRGRGGFNSSSHWNNRNVSTPVS